MNDIVFADKYKVYERRAQNFNKCLKVLVPVQGGDGGRIVYGQGKDEQFSYDSGDYVVVPPYSRHEFAKACGEDLIVCIEQPLIPVSQPVSVVPNAESQGMRHAVQEANFYLNKDGAGGVVAALGQLIVGYIIADQTIGQHPVVVTLKSDMEKNFTDNTYSAEIALRKIPLNYDYVRKLFKKDTGVTPHEYLNGIRMNRARMYIENGITNSFSNYTVAQIAEACGFSEPLYFSRVFKKYYGISPLNYARERCGK